ncbi:peptidoglycan bridge formation glycyltransferase FemA/FemB family protein [Candidatus Gracilibacteria bacterium]|nr:peptidoglycan bridge formation glycyltransferase FemA/FemB family protein [Candidatus Gracilibacteria bacterium]
MSIWQTKPWQEMLKKSGQVEKTIEIKTEKKIFFIEKRKVSLGEFGLFALGVDFSLLSKDFFDEVKKICKKEKALFSQIESLDYEEKNIFLNEKGFEKGYYKKFITPYTAIINLTKSEEEILAEMKQKGRYNIRLAEKKGVEIYEAEKTDENIKIFYDLMNETTSRDGFFGNKFDYYKIFLEELDFSKLLFADYEGKIISAGIFTYFGKEAIYYYGASTSDKNFRNLMAPYLLQWEAIKIGKWLGCEIYDFLGIASPDDENSPLLGVTDFKLKFTKDSKNVSTSFIYKHKKFKYFLIEFLRKFKK